MKTSGRKGSAKDRTAIVVEALADITQAMKALPKRKITILTSYSDAGGSHISIVGFTNTKDADIKKEFGPQFDGPDEGGRKREWLTVSHYAALFDKWPGADESSLRPSD